MRRGSDNNRRLLQVLIAGLFFCSFVFIVASVLMCLIRFEILTNQTLPSIIMVVFLFIALCVMATMTLVLAEIRRVVLAVLSFTGLATLLTSSADILASMQDNTNVISVITLARDITWWMLIVGLGVSAVAVVVVAFRRFSNADTAAK